MKIAWKNKPEISLEFNCQYPFKSIGICKTRREQKKNKNNKIFIEKKFIAIPQKLLIEKSCHKQGKI